MKSYITSGFAVVCVIALGAAAIGDSHTLGSSEAYRGVGGTIAKSSLPALPALSHLIGYYTYDNADSSVYNIIDRSGKRNSLQAVAGPTSTPGTIAEARQFNGTSQEVLYPIDSASVSQPWQYSWISGTSGTKPWTFCTSIKYATEAVRDTTLFSVSNGSTGGSQVDFDIRWANQPGGYGPYLKLYWGGSLYSYSFVQTGGLIDDSKWTDVCVVSVTGYATGNLTMYVNAVSVPFSSSTLPGIQVPGGIPGGVSQAMYSHLNGDYNNGARDEESWWDVALTSDQVKTIHTLHSRGVPLDTWLSAPARIDQYWASVVYMSHLDTTSWVDEIARHTPSTSGDATLGTGLFINGASVPQPGNPIRYPSSSDFLLHSDFTVEAAVNAPLIGAQRSIVEAAVPATSLNWAMWLDPTGHLLWHNGSGFVLTSPSPIPTNTWTRLAVSFQWSGSGATGTYRMYVDGTQVATAAGSWPTFSTLGLLAVAGHDDDTTHGLGGVVDEVRVTTANRYSGSSYTVDASAFPTR